MSTLLDYLWLTDPATAPQLKEVSADPRPELQQLATLRKELTPKRARLLVEQVALRRRAAAKYGDLAATMFFTPIHLEQATDRWIAAYKASRFQAAGEGAAVTDYCCGIGGDLLALAAHGPVVGWDLSETACLLAAANLRAALGASIPHPATVRAADVEQLTPAPQESWHLDPDRRARGQRSTTLEHHSPGPALVDRWLTASPQGAVKLAPACEPPEHWASEAELEWITSQRECRQLVVWFGRLAAAPGTRRATIVAANEGSGAELFVGTFAGAPDVPCTAADEPRGYVFDPDPAVMAARLLGALADHHQLQSLGAGGAYLTGDRPLADPLLQTFVVQETIPLRTNLVAQYLAARGVGRVEVKKRGVAVDPEKFRRDLKLRGDNAATVILTRIGKRQVALIAERLEG